MVEEPTLLLTQLRNKQYQYHRKKDGTHITVSVTGDIIQQKETSVALVIAEDVTQKLEAEKRLQRSERQYRTLFHHNPLPTWIYEKGTGKILAVNEAAVWNYGYTKEKFLNLPVFDLHPPKQQEKLKQ